MLHVSVTAEDITKGDGESTFLCPVALAAARAALQLDGHHAFVRCGYAGIDVRGRSYDLPPAVTTWIHTYDTGGLVGPIEFDL